MKIRLTFKTPDVAEDALQDMDLSDDDRYEAEEAIRKFIKYGEYVNIEIDTKTQEATVIEV